MLLDPVPNATQVTGSELKIPANNPRVDTEPNVVDIGAQIGSFTNFGTDVMDENSYMKRDMVIAVE